ncbi:MAG: hypothetical protein EA425_06650 [Puniceicoccaceae bacterium]|nr:MAG: hypothetical protein EA425_06650 [Puniceicoccaceae bacterium]
MTAPSNPAARRFRWGYSGVYPGAFLLDREDQDWNRIRFNIENGFYSTNVSLDRLKEDPAFRDRVGAAVSKHDLALTPHPRVPWFAEDSGEARRAIEAFLTDLKVFKDLVRAPIVPFSVGRYHRFMETPSLPWQLERLADLLPPFAKACHELGCPLGIENHCDYYLSELVGLCETVPHLGIFLDTGNCFMLGEKIWEEIEAAAPHVVGTHFKDHLVHPDESILHFVVQGASIGEGHARLREVFTTLINRHPDPEKICFQLELVPPKDLDPWESLRRSKAFLETLPGIPG